MEEAYVQLSCPDCEKSWDETAGDLPAPDSSYQCPDCGGFHSVADFTHTKRDLETLQQLQ